MKSTFIRIFLLLLFGEAYAQNLVPCAENGLFGFCDEKGQIQINRIYQKALAFHGNLAPVVREDGFWWFINKKGHHLFNSRAWADQSPPILTHGLFQVRYFDPIFADVTEYYNRNGLPVRVDSGALPVADTLPYTIFKIEDAIALAKSRLGTPYGVDKLDCSGYMRFIFGNFGIVLPYYAREIGERGREISVKELKAGDLVFFGGNPGFEKNINHVGMVISVSNGTFDFIHASTSKGIIINKGSEKYYKTRFLFARRIFG
jgi:cell wall-associated NlpC family hydrolase